MFHLIQIERRFLWYPQLVSLVLKSVITIQSEMGEEKWEYFPELLPAESCQKGEKKSRGDDVARVVTHQ